MTLKLDIMALKLDIMTLKLVIMTAITQNKHEYNCCTPLNTQIQLLHTVRYTNTTITHRQIHIYNCYTRRQIHKYNGYIPLDTQIPLDTRANGPRPRPRIFCLYPQHIATRSRKETLAKIPGACQVGRIFTIQFFFQKSS